VTFVGDLARDDAESSRRTSPTLGEEGAWLSAALLAL
jgi:hypothetical protein